MVPSSRLREADPKRFVARCNLVRRGVIVFVIVDDEIDYGVLWEIRWDVQDEASVLDAGSQT